MAANDVDLHDVIRLAPPLNTTRAECDRALEVLREAFESAPPVKA